MNMEFKLRPKKKRMLIAIMIVILLVIGAIIGKGDWKAIYNPVMIWIYFIYSLIIYRNIKYKESYIINDNKLMIIKGKNDLQIKINEIKEISIIDNIILGGGSFSTSRYLILDNDKISISLWYWNEEGENILEHLEKYYGIKVKKEVNISTTRK